ncbi:RING finger and CHY zinc finger domain-containing 1-like, partial [Paramuricea clavata]
ASVIHNDALINLNVLIYLSDRTSGNDILATDFYYHNTPSDVLQEQFIQAYISASNGSQNSQSPIGENWIASNSYSYQRAQKQRSKIERLEAENVKLKRISKTLSHEIKAKTTLSQLQITELREENNKLAITLANKDAEIQGTFLELSRLSVELTTVNQTRIHQKFKRFGHLPSAQWPSRLTARGHSTGSADQSRSTALGFQKQFQVSRANSRKIVDTAGISSSTQRATQRSVARNGPSSHSRRPHPLPSTSTLSGKETLISSTASQGIVVTDAAKREDAGVQASGSTVRGDQVNASRNSNPGSNGQKLSKFQPPDADEDDQWLCSHYKRRCYVKFECCNKFWPCHRCHNNQSTCGRRTLKARDTKQLKCAACGLEQPFAHYCSKRNAKFARYFCGLCKHLTGTDDNPYHCEKCGICRIHGDRSFHCDVCGVCLDVQLHGNHKCRAGSAHDECCICLEDAFTGCQILPCSHKVHKECATQMIRSGITRCPICRESFAHKLERRPHPSKKRPVKQ